MCDLGLHQASDEATFTATSIALRGRHRTTLIMWIDGVDPLLEIRG